MSVVKTSPALGVTAFSQSRLVLKGRRFFPPGREAGRCFQTRQQPSAQRKVTACWKTAELCEDVVMVSSPLTEAGINTNHVKQIHAISGRISPDRQTEV